MISSWLRFTGLIIVGLAIWWAGSALRSHRAQVEVLRADPQRALADPVLRATALRDGAPIYRQYCASCHGAAGTGDRKLGVPDLTDDDHLFGNGRVSEIEQIARYGIRAHDSRGWNLASMPAYATPVPYPAEPIPPQDPAGIEALTQYLLSFTGRATDPAAVKRGATLYGTVGGCWDCHGHDAGGDPSIGAPTLSDDIWLYGGDHDTIYRTIAQGRAGVSPAFAHILSPAQLRNVAIYVAALAPPYRSLRFGAAS